VSLTKIDQSFTLRQSYDTYIQERILFLKQLLNLVRFMVS